MSQSDSVEVQEARHRARTDADIMSISVVRRLCQIQRQLDGLRVDSRCMVPRPDAEVISLIYKAEGALIAAARGISPRLTEHYLREERH
jgi:hypothetical protein